MGWGIFCVARGLYVPWQANCSIVCANNALHWTPASSCLSSCWVLFFHWASFVVISAQLFSLSHIMRQLLITIAFSTECSVHFYVWKQRKETERPENQQVMYLIRCLSFPHSRKLVRFRCHSSTSTMDPSLLKERAAFKARAMAVPVIEKRKAKEPSSDRPSKRPKLPQKPKGVHSVLSVLSTYSISSLRYDLTFQNPEYLITKQRLEVPSTSFLCWRRLSNIWG